MLEVKDLCRTYVTKKGVSVSALDHVNLKLPSIGMVFILGKSGSGKSTLLNVLGGLDKYDSGEIIIKGKSSKDFSQSEFDSYRNTYLGFIFQEYNILEEFTVGANIALAIELQGRKASNDEVNQIMKEVDLDGYGTRKPNELSGGQKQRVAIARALVKNPEIIMADEPTGALDSKTGIQVFETLKKLSLTKLVLVVSHDREFAEQYGDRVIELADGKIISDIEKYSVASKENNKGISIIDDKILQVKKGYKLSPADLELINSYIGKASNSIYISLDESTNDKVRQFARIDEDGNRESFKDTDQNKIIFDPNAKFSLIKSRLSARHSFKMGVSGLKVKPFRLFITILLSFIAFCLFGLSDTMASYNKINTAVQSFIDSDISNVTFKKSILVEDSYEMDAQINDSDLTILKEKTNIEYKGVFSTYASYSSNFKDSSKISNLPYYTSRALGLSVFSSIEELNNLGFAITGNLPTQKNEIAITAYQYDHFAKSGYKNYSTSDSIEISDITKEKLIGKKLDLDGSNQYTITGIIETNFDDERYKSLKEQSSSNDLMSYAVQQEFNAVLSYGYHNLFYISQAKANEIIAEQETGHRISDNISISTNISSTLESETYLQYYNKLSNMQNVRFFNSAKTSIGDNEAVISCSELLDGIQRGLQDTSIVLTSEERTFLDNGITEDSTFYNMNNYINTYREHYIIDYVDDTYDEAVAKGFNAENFYRTSNGLASDAPVSLTPDEEKNQYRNYLTQNYAVNDYGYSHNKLENLANIDVIFKFYDRLIEAFPNLHDLSLKTTSYNGNGQMLSTSKTYTIVGVVSDKDYSSRNTLVVSDKLYDETIDDTSGIYSFALGKMPTNRDEIRKIVEFNYNNVSPTKSSYSIINSVTVLLDNVNSFIETSVPIFLYIGIGFAVFSSLMLFNFISLSISHKKREIGILRAVGARSKDVFKIFFSESLVIAIINFILAAAALITVVTLINTTLRNDVGLLITFLNVGIRQFVLLLCVSVLVAAISSFLPVYNIARKRPIDAIRNR